MKAVFGQDNQDESLIVAQMIDNQIPEEWVVLLGTYSDNRCGAVHRSEIRGQAGSTYFMMWNYNPSGLAGDVLLKYVSHDGQTLKFFLVSNFNPHDATDTSYIRYEVSFLHSGGPALHAKLMSTSSIHAYSSM